MTAMNVELKPHSYEANTLCKGVNGDDACTVGITASDSCLKLLNFEMTPITRKMIIGLVTLAKPDYIAYTAKETNYRLLKLLFNTKYLLLAIHKTNGDCFFNRINILANNGCTYSGINKSLVELFGEYISTNSVRPTVEDDRFIDSKHGIGIIAGNIHMFKSDASELLIDESLLFERPAQVTKQIFLLHQTDNQFIAGILTQF
ncbi:uncharacterized protein ASCRUDRAFT_72999 [Ascoidea rubescens DSM 1968]|uniref:Uncharacterized protein n=1 Tax=Ascoidea rubescens DSM 1968 TaxID=1344418 RepID=A0A1D2V977_9ASCO|nr:hypothetical protein ASCRUDRAFT_72999 [Ascoidea rubescens DSM 1968]ODV58003.1 hypothetical protein ASCRUDRAFT_72999 [Ascoidea rubescens DSM 1968]